MEGNFIKTQPFQFKESVPAIVGMDVSKVQPYSNNIAKEIGDTLYQFAKKTEAVDQANGVAQLKSQLNDLENEYRLNVLSNPTAFDTEEGRKAAAEQYNQIVEKKKKLLLDGQGKFTKEQYFDLTDYMKTQTVNTITNSQTKINQGYVVQNTSMVNVNNDKLLESLQLTDDPREQDSIVGTMMSNLETLRGLGVDVEPMQLKLIGTAQETLINREIYDKIINNTDNEEFYERDGNGNIVYLDTEGTIPKIDMVKKAQALKQLENSFLSDEACREQAKQISKMTKVSEEDAFNYIRNDRRGNWIKITNKMNNDLEYKASIQQDRMMQNQQKRYYAGEEAARKFDNSSTLNQLYDAGVPATEDILKSLNQTIEGTNTTYAKVFTGYDSTKSMYDAGVWIDVVSDEEKTSIVNDLTAAKSGEDILSQGYNLSLRDSYNKNNLSDYDLKMKMQSIASQVKKRTVTKDLLYDSLIDQNPTAAEDLNTLMKAKPITLSAGYATLAPSLFNDISTDEAQALLQIIRDRPQEFGLQSLVNVTDDDKALSTIVNGYNSDKKGIGAKINQKKSEIQNYFKSPAPIQVGTTKETRQSAVDRAVSKQAVENLTTSKNLQSSNVAERERAGIGMVSAKQLNEGQGYNYYAETFVPQVLDRILDLDSSEDLIDIGEQLYKSTPDYENKNFNPELYGAMKKEIIKRLDNDTLHTDVLGDIPKLGRFQFEYDKDVQEAMEKQYRRRKNR